MEQWSNFRTLATALVVVSAAGGAMLALSIASGDLELPDFKARSESSASEGPPFSSCTSFSFYSRKGTMVFHKASGAERRRDDSDGWRGMPTFVIAGPTSGIVRGNAGSADVRVYRTGHAIIFTETTEAGNRQVFTVTDQWDGEGFRASYTREATFGDERMQSTYSGIAKPIEY